MSSQIILQAAQSSGAGQLSLDGTSVKFSSDSLNIYSERDDSVEQLQLSARESAVEMDNLLRANSLRTTRITTNSVSSINVVFEDEM